MVFLGGEKRRKREKRRNHRRKNVEACEDKWRDNVASVPWHSIWMQPSKTPDIKYIQYIIIPKTLAEESIKLKALSTPNGF